MGAKGLMDLDGRYILSPRVKVRSEEFGGLIYDYDHKSLYLVNSPLLMRFLVTDGEKTVAEIMRELPSMATRSPIVGEKILAALQELEIAGVIREI